METTQDQSHPKKVEEQEVQAAAQLWKHYFAFSRTLLIKAAVRLGIADIIHEHGGLMTLQELASKLPMETVNMSQFHQVMRYMAHMMKLFKVVTKSDEEEYYGLTPASKLLLKDHKNSLAPLLMIDELDLRDQIPRWLHLIKGLDKSRYPKTYWESDYGMPYYEVAENDAEWNQRICNGMTSLTNSVIGSLVEGLKRAKVVDDVSTLVDVGGNTGDVAKAILGAFPHLKCTVLELPHVVENAPKYPNLDFEAGDMLEGIPSADAVLLKSVLHNHEDDICIKVLSKCKEAIVSGSKRGKVILVEIVLGIEDRQEVTNVRFGIDMEMISMGGKERSKKEWATLFRKAGFSHHKIIPITALESIIVIYP